MRCGQHMFRPDDKMDYILVHFSSAWSCNDYRSSKEMQYFEFHKGVTQLPLPEFKILSSRLIVHRCFCTEHD